MILYKWHQIWANAHCSHPQAARTQAQQFWSWSQCCKAQQLISLSKSESPVEVLQVHVKNMQNKQDLEKLQFIQ